MYVMNTCTSSLHTLRKSAPKRAAYITSYQFAAKHQQHANISFIAI
jgi:hypothetical protein